MCIGGGDEKRLEVLLECKARNYLNGKLFDKYFRIPDTACGAMRFAIDALLIYDLGLLKIETYGLFLL
jgi:hypothetical protein